MEYKDTLNLPKTDFPMKANLSNSEPERIKKWENDKLYQKIVESRDKNKKYILHDGPPYANGHIHIGHALNKILKDFIIKVKTLQGYYTPYVPGWDCHGLPIEHQVDKMLGKKKYEMEKSQIRKECRKYAEKFIDIQRDEFKRLGVLGDWENPYITMDYVYEAVTLKELYKFFKNKGVYKGLKPVYWCTSCVTALAEAEVEYDNHTSNSIYVKFPVRTNTAKELGIPENTSVVIWTTTPWTLPANLGLAFNPEYKYSLIKINDTENKNLSKGEHIIVANELLEKLTEIFSISSYEKVKSFSGSDFERKTAKHPFYDRDSLMILGDHVTLEQGTGIVHTAPGHGQEDYEVGLKYGLEILNPVDDNGFFKKDTEIFAGEHIVKANDKIIAYMDENGTLLNSGKVDHSYPHCWRCKNPVVFRATPQWFISMEQNNLRDKTLEEIKKIKWIPAWGENRITAMIENRPDWCISRQRTWGVPIAVFLCQECGEIIINDEIMDKVYNAFLKQGADAWFDHDNEYFLGKDFKCPHCDSEKIRKETDILDVWFDSGVSHAAVCETREELGWPANMYLEGSDQHRGWFHSTILESVGTRGKAPYSEVLTHGFVVDGSGKKMSKSLGNVVTPEEIIKKYGAEILRLWVAAEDYTEDVRISQNIITRLVESYRKIRNSSKYILGNISDFNPDTDMVDFENLLDIDKYMLMKWQKVKSKVYEAFDKYQFHIFYHTLNNFCINDLSAFYHDIIKDRLYCYKKDSNFRRSAQTVNFVILKELCVLMSPILSFTADEVWEYLPEFKGKSRYVFTEHFAPVDESIFDDKLYKKWETIYEIKKDVNKALELKRVEKVIGHPLDAKVTIGASDDILSILKADEGIEKIFIVSEVVLKKFEEVEEGFIPENRKLKIAVEASNNEKCERCWIKSETVGKFEDHKTICERCYNEIS
ncbi:MAG: Isoleucyl-tRNA synthetase [Deferribacteraceae bacterium]|nr:Isoleucyl-tRNA synthetase [Deferribacteraceae bacterium]